MIFRDRTDAGAQLARRLARYASDDPIVLGLPRGGVLVAYEIAAALHAPLDVWIARKLGLPRHPDVGVGAIAEDSEVVVDSGLISSRRSDDLPPFCRKLIEESGEGRHTLSSQPDAVSHT